jgi:hydrogenase maturation protein HypF
LRRGLNSPLTSSAGRLFDAVASFLGLRQVTRFEGQAAMELEFLLRDSAEHTAYKMGINTRTVPIILDWQPTMEAVLSDLDAGIALASISARFHNALIDGIVGIAKHFNCERVALSGGCFQNRFLTEGAIARLRETGFSPYWHQRVPPNDGGICLGQVVAAGLWKV